MSRIPIALLVSFAASSVFARAADPTAPASDTDQVVQMEAFTVSTALGNYAEGESSAAAKFPIDVKELPATVQILNANFIGDQDAESLSKIFPYLVGMTQSSTAVNDYTMRGFNAGGGSPTTLNGIQIDGMPGLTQRHNSPGTANIERVEVLKGPSSLLYGRIQPGGLIDLITKRPLANQAVTFFGTASTFDGETSHFGAKRSYTATIDATGPVDADKHLLYRVILNREDIHSFIRFNFDDNWFLYPSLTYRWNDQTSLTVQVEVSQEKHLFYSGIVAPFNNIYNIPAINTDYQEPSDIEHDIGDALSSSFTHTIADRWTLHAATRSVWEASYRRMLNNNNVTSTIPLQNSTLVRTLQHVGDGRRYNTVDVNVAGEAGPERFSHQLLVGATYGLEWYESNRTGFGNKVPAINVYAPVLGVTPYPPDGSGLNHTQTKYTNYSAYVSDLMKFGPHWRLMLGGRYDGQNGANYDVIAKSTSNQSGGKAEPQAGILYDTQAGISLYASYAESFQSNLLTVYDASNNSNFPPITATQYEFGGKADFLNRTVSATLAAYEIRETNVLESTTAFNSAGNAISILSGVQESRGLEFQGSWLPISNWEFQLGASYMPTATTLKSNTPSIVGVRLANDPRFSGSFWTRYNVPMGAFKGFGVGLGVLYTGARINGNTPASFIAAPGYTRVNAAFYYTWTRYDFALNVDNALDRTYIQALGSATKIIPGDPRKLIFSVKARF